MTKPSMSRALNRLRRAQTGRAGDGSASPVVRAYHGLSIMSWSRAFRVPITTFDGLMLRTLRDAGEYIQALPRAKHKQPEWQIAAEMLL